MPTTLRSSTWDSRTHTWRIVASLKDGSLSLDRLALLNHASNALAPRRHHAPEVFQCRGSWLLFNRSETEDITVIRPDGVQRLLGPGLLCWLANGISEVRAYQISIRLDVRDAADQRIPAEAGPITLTEVPKKIEALERELEQKPLLRGSLAARYQLYFVDWTPVRVLTAQETAECFPAVGVDEVHLLQGRIKYRTKLDLHGVGPFLRDHGIITATDVNDLTHHGCDHPWLR